MQKHAWTHRVFAVTAAAGLLIPIIASAAILRNLKLGDRGLDVKELQQVLNKDEDTRIALSGAGSPGNETEYFGALTFAAVKKLQQKYASDILTPVGLTTATGYVGGRTRLFLLRISGSADSLPIPPSPTTNTPIQTPPIATPLPGKPKIISISPATVTKNTEEITITGINFTPGGNTVVISSESPNAFTNLPSENGTIRLLFRFSGAIGLKKTIDLYRADGRAQAVADALAANIREPKNKTKTTLVPVILVVKNANGESESQKLIIDMKALLNEIVATQ